MKALDRVRVAYSKLVRDDLHLLQVNSSERSLTHRLAVHMSEQFPEWHIDCEYNRDGRAVKTLDGPVLPDIIVHRRGTNHNHVIIEAKKQSTIGNGDDTQKLVQLKEVLSYQSAIQVIFPTGIAATHANAMRDVLEVM